MHGCFELGELSLVGIRSRHMMISGNLAVAMNTSKETNTTKSSVQDSSECPSSYQQLPVYIAMVANARTARM